MLQNKKQGGKKGKPKKGKKGKFKVVMPICQESQEVRRPDGGPPEKYVIKQVLETDLMRFNRFVYHCISMYALELF